MSIPEKFVGWMELETSYAQSKFTAVEQYPYFEQGVARGDFSFRESALSYLRRAQVFRREVSEQDDELWVQVARNLGKAAHNLVALEATARTYHSSRGRLIATELDTFHTLSRTIRICEPPEAGELQAGEDMRKVSFGLMQAAQDQGDMPVFHVALQREMRTATNQFISVAEQYGWPMPGKPDNPSAIWQP